MKIIISNINDGAIKNVATILKAKNKVNGISIGINKITNPIIKCIFFGRPSRI